jgi:hypothetical protein
MRDTCSFKAGGTTLSPSSGSDWQSDVSSGNGALVCYEIDPNDAVKECARTLSSARSLVLLDRSKWRYERMSEHHRRRRDYLFDV